MSHCDVHWLLRFLNNKMVYYKNEKWYFQTLPAKAKDAEEKTTSAKVSARIFAVDDQTIDPDCTSNNFDEATASVINSSSFHYLINHFLHYAPAGDVITQIYLSRRCSKIFQQDTQKDGIFSYTLEHLFTHKSLKRMHNLMSVHKIILVNLCCSELYSWRWEYFTS